MIEVDELKLLAGIPYEINGVGKVKPLKIREIAEMGEEKYNKTLSITCFDIDELLKDLPEEQKGEIVTFDVIFGNYIQDVGFKDLFDNAMSLFLGEKITISEQYCFHVGDLSENPDESRVINRENYETIKAVLKAQNGIGGNKDKMPEAGNSMADEFMKQMEELKNKYKKYVDKKDNLKLTDLINAIAWKSGIGIESVLNMTIYQLHSALKQLNIIDNYENTMFGIYTGNIDTSKMGNKLKELSWIKEEGK